MHIVEQLFSAPREDLDCYSWGTRQLFRDADGVLSFACLSKLACDRDAQVASTDLIERLSSELTAPVQGRSPGRSFTYAARDACLRQLLVEHQHRGGLHPLRPQHGGVDLATELVEGSPLLPPSDADDPEQRVSAANMAPAAASAAQLDLQGVAHNGVMTTHFGSPVVLCRSNSTSLPSSTARADAATTWAPRAGLSPYVLELNKCMAEAKRLKGSTLTSEEIRITRMNFRNRWARTNNREVFTEAYKEWRSQEPAPRNDDSARYNCIWGGGSSSCPVASEELWAYQRMHGWPHDNEVYDDYNAFLLPRI